MSAVVHDHPGMSAPQLSERYEAVRSFTERLAAPLSPEDQTVQSMPDVSPTKWHRAHTSWFFETFLLEPYLPDYQPFHPDYAYLFNSYYEAVGPRYARAQRGCVSRPGIGEVAAYRGYVDEHMGRLLDGGLDERAGYLTDLGLHHEQQHQELLLMDIKHVLSMSPLDPAYSPVARPSLPGGGRANWVAHQGGNVEIGHDGDGFAFDNEGPRHEVLLRSFALADRLVTCSDWLDFIDAGGYQTAGLWLSDGWAAVQSGGWEAPLYWRDGNDGWTVFTLNGSRPVEPTEPVCHVSYYEADAFATWAGARLPTEQEWEAVAAGQPVTGQLSDPCDVHPRPQTEPAFYGDVWVWTASAYLPYPGFEPAAGAVGEYNGKFMVNQHALRGGCCATPTGHVRSTYRNFFPPASRWPFTGVRLAKDI
jgi:ergothioneine biosynthesis protein EgtB